MYIIDSLYFSSIGGEDLVKLVINAGHGIKNIGDDPGAIGFDGLKESTETREVGNLVAEKLKYNNIDVLIIQDGDLWDVSNGTNSWFADYFISIHCNSFSDPTAHGIETYAYRAGTIGDKLAQSIHKELVPATGLYDRGLKYANYHVLRETNMPAVLTEIGFISNPKENALMNDPQWDDKVATAISKGFCKFIGASYQEPSKKNNSDKNQQAINLLKQAISLMEG